MDLNSLVSIQTFDTSQPLGQELSGWYMEQSVENYTDVPIYVLRPNGQIIEVAPLYEQPLSNKRVLLKSVSRTGLPLSSYRGKMSTGKNPAMEISVDFDRLLAGPYFCKDMGIAISTAEHRPRLISENYLDPEYVTAKVTTYINNYLQQGNMTPIVVRANSHNTEIEYLYLAVNDFVMSAKVDHNLEAAEELVFCFTRRNGYTRCEMHDLNWDNMDIREELINKTKWVFGTDLGKVQDYVSKKISDDEFKLSSVELNHRIELETAQLKKDLQDKDTTIEQLRKELALVRKELENTKYELSKANESSRMSTEQQMNAYKLANAIEENRLANEKRQLAKEQAIFEFERDKVKAGYENQIQNAKIRKEEISVSGAETSNLGTAMKTAAVVIPAVVGAGMLLATHGAAGAVVSTGKMIAPVISKTVTTGAMMVGTAASALIDQTKDTTVKISKAVKNLLGKITKKVKDTVCDAIKTAYEVAKSTVKAVVDIGCSIVNNIVNVISTGVRAVGNFIGGLFS